MVGEKIEKEIDRGQKVGGEIDRVVGREIRR